jgi:hypothetical protein
VNFYAPPALCSQPLIRTLSFIDHVRGKGDVINLGGGLPAPAPNPAICHTHWMVSLAKAFNAHDFEVIGGLLSS